MKNFTEKWEKIFMAAAFAEAGEFETARDIIRETTRAQRREIQSPRKSIRVSGNNMR